MLDSIDFIESVLDSVEFVLESRELESVLDSIDSVLDSTECLESTLYCQQRGHFALLDFFAISLMSLDSILKSV